jgi:large subunit ribosomal protein L30
MSQNQQITVKQTGSVIGRNKRQESILFGLGLKRIGQTRTLVDTPSTRGMIDKVRHLVQILDN